MLLATVFAMIFHIRYINEFRFRSRMRDIDQPCRWSGDSSVSPDIRRKTWNDRSFFLVPWRSFDEVKNDRQELTSLESMDCSYAYIPVPSACGHSSTNFARLGRIRCNNANTWTIDTH